VQRLTKRSVHVQTNSEPLQTVYLRRGVSASWMLSQPWHWIRWMTSQMEGLRPQKVVMSPSLLTHEGGGSQASEGGHVTVFVDARRSQMEGLRPQMVVMSPSLLTHEGTIRPRLRQRSNTGHGWDQTFWTRCCVTGRVQIVGLDNGAPVVVSRAARAIPPAIRHAVTRRDGVCVIDGCNSRYRLEPHHIQRFSDGGTHHLDNLATMCWYHHHVAVHGDGYRIDPQSPPLRRRLTRAGPTPDPEPP